MYARRFLLIFPPRVPPATHRTNAALSMALKPAWMRSIQKRPRYVLLDPASSGTERTRAAAFGSTTVRLSAAMIVFLAASATVNAGPMQAVERRALSASSFQ